ncbi:BACON domain-containing protein [Galbibacter pacificus]|uniref:BACON domain-containing carbohydrate-binding protein n=1 Tax=Galbibacter pacificus TaxID=2996052 RepID=A0ABT6FQC5_9FLAO|nr:BACON domain-containing carbohydrate-binding protein [Galbibacter pacificus]MDG3582057.1 BACON domain-containing carbohydrate-binding protein [Galbibacter pacificus]MDG3585469.1 BACON domain-containing carbohydrate-binding protein [Galbibacter pacificus]
MGRAYNQIITHDDLVWMENNNLLFPEIPAVGGKLCVIRGTLNIHYKNLDTSLLTNYPTNRLVPYQRVKQYPIFTVDFINSLDWDGDTGTAQVFNAGGYSWTISWKLFKWWIYPPPLDPDWQEDTGGSWFSASPTSGSNAPTINFTIDYNDTPEQRMVELTITSNGGANSYTTYLYQDANPGVDTQSMPVSTGSNAENACLNFVNEAGRLDYYIKDGYTWTGADVLYVNEEGTEFAPTGWYSNGAWARNWNKANKTFYGLTQCEEDNSDGGGDPVDPHPETQAIAVSTGSDAASACTNYANVGSRLDYYIEDGYTWTGATVLYTDDAGTTLADTGWYSNGSWARYWNKANETFYGLTAC